MAVHTDRPPVVEPKVTLTGWAWISLAMIIPGFVVMIVLTNVMGAIVGVDVANPETVTGWENLVYLPGLLVLVAAPVAAAVLGVRAVRAGQRSGWIPGVLGGLVGVTVVVIQILDTLGVAS